MKRNQSEKKNYVCPKVEMLQMGSQSVLATSGNPSITNPSMGWSTQRINDIDEEW